MGTAAATARNVLPSAMPTAKPLPRPAHELDSEIQAEVAKETARLGRERVRRALCVSAGGLLSYLAGTASRGICTLIQISWDEVKPDLAALAPKRPGRRRGR